MKARALARLVVVLGVLALVATACAVAPGEREAVSGELLRGGTIVDGAISDVKTLQPVLSRDTVSSHAWSFIYQSLTRANPETGQIEGNLAESFALSPDGLTMTFRLRDGLVWSDGSPFTGEDYKFTAEAVMRSKRTLRKSSLQDIVGAREFEQGKLDNITGIQVSPDGKTITVRFAKVFCPSIVIIGGAGTGGIIPKKYFGRYLDPTDFSKNLDDAPENLAPPVSIGPFVFKDFRPGDRIVLERNDRYFRGAPLVDRYIIKTYADSTAVKAALVTGEVHLNTVQALDFEELSRVAGLASYRFPSFGYNYIGWNPNAAKAPWLRSREVRQALWYGLDVDAIMRKILFGLGTRVYAHTPPPSWAYDDSDLHRYPYDPRKAKQLLEQAGARMGPDGIYRWVDGRPMVTTIETNSGNAARETIQVFAQEQYRQVGVKIDLILESFPALLDRTTYGNPDFQGWVLGYSLGLDPNPVPFWHSSSTKEFNRTGYSNPVADRAMEEQLSVPGCDQEKRKQLIHVVDKALNEDAIFTFLYSADSLLFVNTALQNVKPTAYSTYWNIHEWWITR